MSSTLSFTNIFNYANHLFCVIEHTLISGLCLVELHHVLLGKFTLKRVVIEKKYYQDCNALIILSLKTYLFLKAL